MPRIAVDLSVLRDSRNLRLLILGAVFSSLGAQAALVAIPYQVYTLTHSAALVGLLGIVELVPIVVCSLLAGAIADRIERRRLMFAAQAMISVAAALLAAGASPGSPPVGVIYLLAALLAAGSTVDNVTRSAIVPALAGDRLRAALSVNYGLYQMAAVIGPAIGGLVIAGAGVGAAYAADAFGFLVMLGVTAALPPLPPAATDAEHPRPPPPPPPGGDAPAPPADPPQHRRGPALRPPQPRADGLVRHRPRGDDLRHAARAVRRARAHRLRRRRRGDRRALCRRVG